MILARVVGTVVATRKDERLDGRKLLVVRPIDEKGRETGGQLVAVDAVQAGANETVICVQGSSARMAHGLDGSPIDTAIVGIVDTIDLNEGA